MKLLQIFEKKIAALVIVVLMVLSCSQNPVTGKKELMLMSEAQERQLGEQSDPSIVAQFGLYDDPQIQKFISEKGQQMAKISHRPNLAYEFKVLDSPVVNAFAVPGGFVYFTRGILAHFNNEAEFAGVLGHEIGHITARHSAKQYSKAMLAQVGLLVGVVVSPEFASMADVAQQGLGLLFLKFGRDAESQSDRLGVEYSTKIGYDAKNMANFFQTLNRMRQESGQTIPTFLSTHPDPADRYNKVKQLAEEWQQKTNKSNLETNRNSYLRMIDGIIYGEDPRQGYVDDDRFYHPELKFTFPIPRGWKTQNSPQQFQMAPSDGKALMVLTLAAEKDLDSAARAVLQNNKLTLINSQRVTVNGFPAIAMLSNQPPQQGGQQSQAITVQTYLIQYNNLIYKIHGMALSRDFPVYKNQFTNTQGNFSRLTDQSRINVKPERIKVVTVRGNGTLESSLRSLGVPQDRLQEIAVLNSMELSTQLSSGDLIKVVEK